MLDRATHYICHAVTALVVGSGTEKSQSYSFHTITGAAGVTGACVRAV